MNTFSLLLVIATLVTGAAWFYDFKVKRPLRKIECEAKVKANPDLSSKEKKKILEPRGLVGQTGSLFFIILIVFIFRSFIIEPFRIPSGSMMPTLLSGDFIAVTKWSYGIRNPLTNSVWIETGTPERGDIIVFKYPEDPSVDYIKRVVGLPGDIVVYKDKELYILPKDSKDRKLIHVTAAKSGKWEESTGLGFVETSDVYEEDLLGVSHAMMINPRAPEMASYYYHQEGSETGIWKVPENCYFAMGDNRDNSRDSRFWGFVPMENIVGKTIGIWLSLEYKENDGIIPSSVRFSRLGGVR